MAIGQKPNMADAVEAVGHGMQQKPAHELAGGEGHRLGLAVVPVVLPGEADLAVGEPGETAVGDGDAMDVAAEIGNHLFRAGEWTLAVDDSLRAAQSAKAPGEPAGLGEISERAGEAQRAGCKRRPQPFEEQRAEPARQHPHRQEEPGPAGDPLGLVGRESSTRDNAVQVWMVLQRLPPGMQHGNGADLGAEVAWARNRMAQTTRLLWNAISAAGAGTVKTTWKYGTGSSSA